MVTFSMLMQEATDPGLRFLFRKKKSPEMKLSAVYSKPKNVTILTKHAYFIR